MGPADKYILRENALSATDTDFQLRFQSHWYRSLPLSCMAVAITIDGKKIAEENMAIEANGNLYPIHQMPELDKEWLFITDTATLHVNNTPPLEQGKRYEISFRLDLFIPYIIVGPDAKPLLASTLVTKKLTCN